MATWFLLGFLSIVLFVLHEIVFFCYDLEDIGLLFVDLWEAMLYDPIDFFGIVVSLIAFGPISILLIVFALAYDWMINAQKQ